MNVFDIIGPIMVGPSSSHTAGAARIGKVARTILGEEPIEAIIDMHGSFAKTYKGHGTDKALLAGLMGFEVDDARIRNSLELAKQKGIKFIFNTVEMGNVHPNTARINVTGESGRKVCVQGASIGGGNIVITEIDGIEVEFTGNLHTLIVCHKDTPGIIASVTNILATAKVNIAYMKVYRTLKGGDAIMVIEADQSIVEENINCIKNISDVSSVAIVTPLNEGW